MITKKGILIIISVLTISACDIVKEPFFENNNSIEESATLRNVLIMDFTAFKCSVCPRAHRIIDNLKELYGDRIIPVSVHMGLLAIPETSGTGFVYDFRTYEGNELSDYYMPSFLPSGLINTYSIDSLQPYSDWAASADFSINTIAEIDISTDITYNSMDLELSCTVHMQSLKNLDNEISLVSLIVEDSIVAWQVDQDDPERYIEKYVHNDVFRKSLTGIWGDKLTAGAIPKGEKISRSLNTFLDDSWITDNIFIVSYVYDFETREILQVIRSKMIN